MATHNLKKPDLFFTITCILAAVSAVVSLISFVLFIRARIKEDEQKENFYKNIHYTALTIFAILLIAALNIYKEPG